MRSVGALRYAHMMSSEEFLKHYAYVRLGISLGIIKDITYESWATCSLKPCRQR